MDPQVPQVTIYLDADTAARAKAAARAAGLSQSRWIAELIRRHGGAAWPDAVRRIAGSYPGFPNAGELRRGLGQDAPRPEID